MMQPNERDESARRRRAIVQRASLYTYGFLAAALVVAVAGSAVVAWIMTGAGLPFVVTWIAVLIIVLLPSLIRMVWQAVRNRS
jgi:FtsH-binding integral membrane protein